MRMLLFRPLFSEFIVSDLRRENHKQSFEAKLAHSFSVQCSIHCVVAAIQAIELLYSAKAVLGGGGISFGCPWWYNILFLYKSAIVLIAARLSPAIVADVSEDSLSHSWGQAVELIDNYGFYSKTARHLLTTLLVLADAVPYQYSKSLQWPRMQQSLISEPFQRGRGVQYGQTQRTDSTMEEYPTKAPGNLGNVGQQNLWSNASSHNTEGLDGFTPTTFDFDTAFDPNDLNWLNLVFE